MPHANIFWPMTAQVVLDQMPNSYMSSYINNLTLLILQTNKLKEKKNLICSSAAVREQNTTCQENYFLG